ncbi:HNH endonuclease signature motif containing protein [Arthrobacter rhombi]|uniref:HNH endonuclease signature motif containing protein n=1 Tax=Arthrobacter rhombi TaxID=71253 RepID=UPI003FD0F882
MTAPIPPTAWQAALPDALPRHIKRNIEPGPGGCWLWRRSKSPDGYGWASLGDKTHQAHRLAYALIVGTIPEGLHLDHKCRVRHCVNPSHLEPVTPRENLARGDTPAGWGRCQRCGGEFSVVGRTTTQRKCKPCSVITGREWRRRNSARARKVASVE